MFIIQIHNGAAFNDNTDGFDDFDEAKAWALTNLADIFEDDYGIKWRIVCTDDEPV